MSSFFYFGLQRVELLEYPNLFPLLDIIQLANYMIDQPYLELGFTGEISEDSGFETTRREAWVH